MAASIIREDIRLTMYPSTSVLEGEDEPDTLKCFIKIVLKHTSEQQPTVNRRYTAIAHALIAACRP